MQRPRAVGRTAGDGPADCGPEGVGRPAESPSRYPAQNEELQLLRALRRLMRLVALRSRRLDAEYGVTGPQLFCLLTMDASGPMTANAVAQQLHVSPSTAVGILDRLVQKGLAARERGANDRRLVFSELTEEGRRLAARAPSLLDSRVARILADLPESERETITRSLDRVADIMEGEQGEVGRRASGRAQSVT